MARIAWLPSRQPWGERRLVLPEIESERGQALLLRLPGCTAISPQATRSLARGEFALDAPATTRRLDDLERAFMRSVGPLFGERLRLALEALGRGQKLRSLPLGNEITRRWQKYVRRVIRYGWRSAGREIQVALERERRPRPDRPYFAVETGTGELEEPPPYEIEYDFEPIPPELGLAYYVDRVPPLRRVADRKLLNATNRIIQDSVSGRLEDGTAEERLRNLFPHFTSARLENIARTETATLYNAGRAMHWNSTDLISAWQWSAILDVRLCEICDAVAGHVFPKEETGLLPAHYQCRCTSVPIFEFEDIPVDGAPEGWEPLKGFGLR